MPAPKGNQFWKQRSSHGRNPIFKNPEQLWEACCEYFEWVDNNPLQEEKLVSYMGITTREPINKLRAMTIQGLCFFLDITDETWRQYRLNKDFSAIVSQIEKVIYEQKFSGAAAELFNPSIIARDLGLADKRDLSSSDGSMTPKGMNDFYSLAGKADDDEE